MSAGAGSLKELHRLHIKLRDVQEQLQRGPKQIQARKQFTERKRKELEDQEAELTRLKKAADEKSLQLKSTEARITNLKSKLNSASSNREYDVIRSQIEADQMANSVLEDEILEAYEAVDRAQEKYQELQQAYEAALSEEKRVEEEFAATEPGLKQQAEELEASLKDAERSLPGEVAEVYRRLVQAHGAGALASVEDDACSACFGILSPQRRVELNTGKIIFCPSCGRLLYRAAEDGE